MKAQYHGRQIMSLAELSIAVEAKQAIANPNEFMYSIAKAGANHIPAAFVFNMSAQVVHRWLQCGMFIYKKPSV